ncbi:hypothetical protein Tco_0665926 [Tanacetum coccineum]
MAAGTAGLTATAIGFELSYEVLNLDASMDLKLLTIRKTANIGRNSKESSLPGFRQLHSRSRYREPSQSRQHSKSESDSYYLSDLSRQFILLEQV